LAPPFKGGELLLLLFFAGKKSKIIKHLRFMRGSFTTHCHEYSEQSGLLLPGARNINIAQTVLLIINIDLTAARLPYV